MCLHQTQPRRPHIAMNMRDASVNENGAPPSNAIELRCDGAVDAVRLPTSKCHAKGVMTKGDGKRWCVL